MKPPQFIRGRPVSFFGVVAPTNQTEAIYAAQSLLSEQVSCQYYNQFCTTIQKDLHAKSIDRPGPSRGFAKTGGTIGIRLNLYTHHKASSDHFNIIVVQYSSIFLTERTTRRYRVRAEIESVTTTPFTHWISHTGTGCHDRDLMKTWRQET